MRCYSHLSDDEREQIGLAKALGHSIGAIAQAVDRPKSTISRELSRNKLPSGRYSPLHAAGTYQLRRRREALIERDRALRTFVVDRLAEGWTPEQISGWLKGGNERRLRAVGCETIYISDGTSEEVRRLPNPPPTKAWISPPNCYFPLPFCPRTSDIIRELPGGPVMGRAMV